MYDPLLPLNLSFCDSLQQHFCFGFTYVHSPSRPFYYSLHSSILYPQVRSFRNTHLLYLTFHTSYEEGNLMAPGYQTEMRSVFHQFLKVLLGLSCQNQETKHLYLNGTYSKSFFPPSYICSKFWKVENGALLLICP